MKTKIILGLVLLSVGLLTNCGSAEKERKLQAHADSLAVELKSNQDAMSTLHEIGTLLDSIDQNRAILRVTMVGGISKLNYASRLKNINRYVNKAESEITRLEASLKKSTLLKANHLGTIHRLKTELENANKQLAVLQEEGAKLRNEKGVLIARVSEKDSLIIEREQFIKVKENELIAKEELARRVDEETLVDIANLYYAQAKALETVADRTRLAPHKKKETRREALELYKIALSLGKTEAQARINELEKEIG